MEWPFESQEKDNNNSINNSVDVEYVLHRPASSSSNVASEGADVIDTTGMGGCASSLLTSFSSIMVEEQGGLEGGQEGGLLQSSPSTSKNKKNPSGCLTGTPSSAQRSWCHNEHAPGHPLWRDIIKQLHPKIIQTICPFSYGCHQRWWEVTKENFTDGK